MPVKNALKRKPDAIGASAPVSKKNTRTFLNNVASGKCSMLTMANCFFHFICRNRLKLLRHIFRQSEHEINANILKSKRKRL